MPRINNIYTKELKLKAVSLYIKNGQSAISVARELSIKNKTQVQRWVTMYKEKGEKAFDTENRGKSKGPRKGRPKTNFNSVEEELKYLRMENEFLKKLHSLSGRQK